MHDIPGNLICDLFKDTGEGRGDQRADALKYTFRPFRDILHDCGHFIGKRVTHTLDNTELLVPLFLLDVEELFGMLRIELLEGFQCCDRRFLIFGAEEHFVEMDLFVEFRARRGVCLIGSGHLADVDCVV